jgi:hypothetical protein
MVNTKEEAVDEPSQPPPWKFGPINGVIYGDPWTYNDGCTTALLRSGVDGPHAGLADRICSLNGRLYA